MADIKIMTEDKSVKFGNLLLPPNNEIIVDDMGEPSVMVKIPKLTYADVGIGDSENPLPAFIVNGQVIPYIYVSKYQNIVKNDRGYSLPYQTPAINLTIDEAHTYCKNKGDGWHLMTNAEWAAIALWCKKHDCMPRGNTYYHRDYYDKSVRGVEIVKSFKQDNGSYKYGYYTATGSGAKNWFHNDDFSGIADLTGNVHEWVGGLRLVKGEIQVIKDNDAAILDKSGNQLGWSGIRYNGTYVMPGTTPEKLLGFHMKNGIIYDGKFKNMRLGDDIKDTVTVPNILKALAIYPNDEPNSYKDDLYIANVNLAEGMPTRGGSHLNVHECGVFNIQMNRTRTDKDRTIGFRSAYIPSTFA